ncbi:uncharacterized protein B0H18DRAFT_1212655 [Fomitopsis serialis]|uniref:uncharacterized protein n=1 Tax=Fomitopsis serialis TaxID=139415 RepID=UPI002007D02A|nr:uncharacterized protein B0H18DRAFT_1212655 [Neoantrodia serialis]KAH9922428.1 hypothetical protein B0H18DRAFT_1212655 [Neoantrodia serialis]
MAERALENIDLDKQWRQWGDNARNASIPSRRTEAVNNLRKSCKSPSAGAKNSALFETQASNRDEAVHNGRPLSLGGTDLFLYHRVFHDFQLKLRRPLQSANLTLDDFKAATVFIERSTRFYPTKTDRHYDIGPPLEAFLGENALTELGRYSATVSHSPDGSQTAVCGLYKPLDPGYRTMLKLISEVRNGIGLGDCCPTEQAEKAYQLTCIDSTLDDLRHCSCMPAFILAIAGPHVSVSGAIFVNGVAISQRITPFTSLVPPLASLSTTPGFEANEMGFVTAGTQHVAEIALLLKSLRECLDGLGTYYRDMRRPTRPDELSPAPCFPSYEANDGVTLHRDGQAGPPASSRPLPDARAKNERTVKLRYLSRIPERRMSFVAEANGGGETGTRCVVKFVHRSGKEAHEFMYERGVAARLMHCQREASVGDLFVVITEYIDETKDAKASQDGITKLRDALEGLHEAQFVFGDLRRVNMLVDSTGQPRLIDFDWSGPDGQMRYPHDLNTTDVAWPEGARPWGS